MSRPVLVDSSWYITKMRNGEDPLAVLRILAESRDLATCGVVKAEVGRGIRNEKALKQLEALWSCMLYIDDGYKRWEATMALAWTLDREGVVLPLTDLHIAACAMHAGAVVLTYDQHFQCIPGIDATDRIF
jgi:predicted nucleic acid-binding protein